MTSESALGDLFRAAVDIPEIPFGEMLWESAQRFPERTAVIFQGQRFSYRELDGLASSFANALATLGVKKGDRVALYMTNRPEYIISLYGIARLGKATGMRAGLHLMRHDAEKLAAQVMRLAASEA